MLLKRLHSEEQSTDKANGEEGTYHCSTQTDSRQKGKEEMSEKILLLENTSLNINKETRNCKGGKAFQFYQAANTCFQWKRPNCCFLLNRVSQESHT